MRLRGRGNAEDEFHVTAMAQNPGHATATFIIPELQGALFARGVLRRPCHSAASSRSIALPFVSGGAVYRVPSQVLNRSAPCVPCAGLVRSGPSRLLHRTALQAAPTA